METPEEQSTIDAKDYTYIVKGKRTKRQKVHSPVPLGISAREIIPVNGLANSNSSNTSPTSSDEFHDSTEEEEDMANCLILLARGHRFRGPVKQAAEGNRNDDVVHPQEERKFNSRKFLEKAGYYVYQCKTCNKAFPSFQALGGHRASHKKPNSSNNSNKSTVMVMEEKINKQLLFEEDDDEARLRKTSSLSLQLSNEKTGNGFLGSGQHNRQMAKIHECSICGAEFTSGQALGGHMRRHRAVQVGSGTALALTAASSLDTSEGPPPRTRTVLSLDLDLNLPAPEDEMLIPAFDSTGQQQQQQHQQQQQRQNHLVFSAPALVDCHY